MYWFVYITHAVNFDVVSSRIYPMVSIHRYSVFGTRDEQYGRSLFVAHIFHSWICCLPLHCQQGFDIESKQKKEQQKNKKSEKKWEKYLQLQIDWKFVVGVAVVIGKIKSCRCFSHTHKFTHMLANSWKSFVLNGRSCGIFSVSRLNCFIKLSAYVT